jgi:hypothetical protein
MEIPIENHKAALAAQQAEFDTALAAKDAIIAGLQATATKDKADAAAAAQVAAAEKAAAIEARNKAVADLAAMTAQDQKHAAAVVAALDWAAIDAEYADLQTRVAANAAKYDTARATLTALANSINEPFVARQLAALEKAEADLKKQREKLAG